MPPIQVFASVRLAYSDMARVLLAMPVIVLVVVVLSAGDTLVDWMFSLSSPVGQPPAKVLLLRLVLGIVEIIALAPALIAIHRFIILNEIARGYTIDSNDARFQMFSAWAVVFFLVTDYPASVFLVFQSSLGRIAGFLAIFLLMSPFIVMAAVLLLFPAVAVDAPGATLRHAIADVRGAFWRIVAILILAMLPVLVVPTIVSSFTEETSKVAAAVWSLAGFCIALIWAAAGSRLFQSLSVSLRTAVSPSR